MCHMDEVATGVREPNLQTPGSVSSQEGNKHIDASTSI